MQALPAQIEKIEDKQRELYGLMSGANFYKKPAAQINRLKDELKQVQQKLAKALARWEELETRSD